MNSTSTTTTTSTASARLEPSGQMDCKSAGGLDGRADFTVCDLADEEDVHFSRHASDYYYQLHGPHHSQAPAPVCQGGQGAGPKQAHLRQQPMAEQQSRFTSTLDTDKLNFAASPWSSGGGIFYQHLGTGSEPVSLNSGPSSLATDQAVSSRLLQALGSKLRRGSNYLNAPTRFLGHYLLGITIQSWCEFFNTARLTTAPKTRQQLSRRLATNLSHFQGNYLCVSLVLVIYCILTSPLLLLAIAAYLMALYLVTVRSALGKQTRLLGFRPNLQQQYSFITMVALPPLWIAGAPSALFWVIGASFFVVGLHAAMYMNERLAGEQLALAHGGIQSAALASPVPSRRFRQASLDFAGPGGAPGRPPLALNSGSQSLEAPPNGYVSLATNLGSAGASQSGAGGYVSSTISQWISFRSAPSGAANSENQQGGPATPTGPRTPEVRIVSSDFAGLGRVYEV